MVVTQVVIWWSHDSAIIQDVQDLKMKRQVERRFRIIQPAAGFGGA